MIQQLTEQLIRHEGLRLKPYRCTAGKLTIGVGRNIEDKGITEDEAMFLLKNDVQQCMADLAFSVFPAEWPRFPEPVRIVLANMRFQLGYTGFRLFRRMIAALRAFDYQKAAAEMLDSNWAKQTPNRANELIGIMRRA